MRAHTIVMFGVSALWLIAARADDPPAEAGATPTAKALLEAHNRERAKEKLPPLTLNAQLQAAAETHARDMAQQEKMSHEGSDGSTPDQRVKKAGYRYRQTGENVAEAYKDVAEVMRGWMDSPPHKKNILGDFTEMGAALARDFDGRPYWCVDFGTPLPPKPDLSPETAEAELIKALNVERKKAGKPIIKRNDTLTRAAQRHADTLAAKDAIVAKDDDGRSALDRVEQSSRRYRRLAEEVASGIDRPEDVVKAWLERASDKANALGDFAEAGVGYAIAKSERTYWCVILGRPAR